MKTELTPCAGLVQSIRWEEQPLLELGPHAQEREVMQWDHAGAGQATPSFPSEQGPNYSPHPPGPAPSDHWLRNPDFLLGCS